MTQVQVLDTARDHAGGYKVDVSRGERIGRVVKSHPTATPFRVQ